MKAIPRTVFLCAAIAATTVAAKIAVAEDEGQGDSPKVASQPVWLSDLPERDVKVGYGQFGKNGQAGFEPGAFTTQGISCEHGLGTHPDSHVEYVLAKKYRTFRATAAMSDTSRTGKRPIEFRVLGDGKLLWQSYGMNGPGSSQPCLLDITGVDVLRLETRYRPTTTGDIGWAHAVWVDPYVASQAPPPAALPLYDPNRFAVYEAEDDLDQQLRNLYEKEDFAQLEKIAQDLRQKLNEREGRNLQSRFYGTLSQRLGQKPDQWKKHLDLLARWQKAEPDSPVPLVLLGLAWRNEGWEIRGGGFASTVPGEAWPKFAECLAKARQYLETAAKNKVVEPQVYSTLISMSAAEGRPLDEVSALLEKGMKVDRANYFLYTAVGMYLEPKWGGNPGDVERFADQIRKRLGGDLGDEVYFRIAGGEAIDLGDKFFTASNFKYKDLLPGIRVALRDHPQNPIYVNQACHMACLADDKVLAVLLLERIDPATHDRFVWGDYSGVERWRRTMDPKSYQGEDLTTITTESGWVRGVAFLNDNHRLLSGGYVPFFDVWNLTTQKPIERFEAKNHIRALAVDEAASQVIVATGDEQSPDSEAIVYELKSGHKSQILKGHSGSVIGVAISRDGTRYGTAARDNTAKIWNRADLSHPLTLNHPEWVFDIAFSPDGRTVATASYQGGIWLWNTKTGEPLGKPLVNMNAGPWQCKLGFVPDGKSLITASVDGTIREWDLAGRNFETVRPNGTHLWQIALSGDSKLLAVGRENGGVDLLSLKPLKIVHSFKGHHSNTQALVFSPDGKTLASGSDDATIKLWSIKEEWGIPTCVHQAADGTLLLKAADANLHGATIRYESEIDDLGYWNDQQDWVDWNVQIEKPGKFDVAMTFGCAKGGGGGRYQVAVGAETLAGTVHETGEWGIYTREHVGEIEIAKPGRITISVKALSRPGPALMNLKLIEIQPAK